MTLSKQSYLHGRKPDNNPLEGLFLFVIVLIITLFLLGSCSPQKKLDKAKGLLERSGKAVLPANKLDSACAAMFPVQEQSTITHESTDSSAYKAALESVMVDLYDANHANDSMFQLLNSKIRDSAGCSVTIAGYRNYISDLKSQIAAFKVKLSLLPATQTVQIKETKVRDMAREHELTDSIQALQGYLAEQETSTEVEKIKGQDAVKAEVKTKDKWRKIALISLAINLLFVAGIFLRSKVGGALKLIGL